MANHDHGNKGRQFRVALPRADSCDNSVERYNVVINASKESRRVQITFFVLVVAIFNSGFSILVYLGTTRTKFLHVKPTKSWSAFY